MGHRRRGRSKAGHPTRPDFTPEDAGLFRSGLHDRLHDHLGCRLGKSNGVEGAWFAVWAPGAERVSVIGDFNGWSLGDAPLAPSGAAGVWGGFLGGVRSGDRYKYHVVASGGSVRADRADPFALHTEPPPGAASVAWSLDYAWGDGRWMEERRRREPLRSPVSIYEVHLGSWRRVPEEGDRPLTYSEIAPYLVDHVTRLGFTHVLLLPVLEHADEGSLGFTPTGHFAPTARHGAPQDLMHLVDALHQAGIGVILDWVPGLFGGAPHGPERFDGSFLFERPGHDRTGGPAGVLRFDHGRPEVRSFLLSSASFWLSVYHVDGLRVPACGPAAESASLLGRLNEVVHEAHAGVLTLAGHAEGCPAAGGLGFDLAWDISWTRSTLSYLQRDPIHRAHHHEEVAARSPDALPEHHVIGLSHDEAGPERASVLSRMAGDEWQRFANLRLLLSLLFAQPGKKLLFMGSEFAQWSPWRPWASLDWHLELVSSHVGVERLIADLNRLYRDRRPLHDMDSDSAGFEWIDTNDRVQSCLSFARRHRSGGIVLAVFNFTPVPRQNYRVGAPEGGIWVEVFNSDAREYGGSGHGNLGGVEAAPVPFHGRRHSLNLTLPPLAAVLLERRR